MFHTLLHEFFQDLQLSPSLVRATARDFTLAEPSMVDLNYQGLDLPILTEKELLEQTWNLEEESDVLANERVGLVDGHAVEENGKRGREDEDDGITSSRKKRARVEEEYHQEDTLHVAVEPLELPPAPGRHGEVPEVVVTPAVTEMPKRRTSPQPLDVDAATVDPALILPGPVQQDVADVQGQAPPDDVQNAAHEAPFLQPLVPAGPRTGGKGGKKNVGTQVDEVTHLRAQDIKVKTRLLKMQYTHYVCSLKLFCF